MWQCLQRGRQAMRHNSKLKIQGAKADRCVRLRDPPPDVCEVNLLPQLAHRSAKVTRFTFKTSTILESRLHRPQPVTAVTVPCNHLERATNQRRQFNGVMTSRARSNPGKARAHILLRIRLLASGQWITHTLPVIGLAHTAEHLARGQWRRQRRSLCLMQRVARLGKAVGAHLEPPFADNSLSGQALAAVTNMSCCACHHHDALIEPIAADFSRRHASSTTARPAHRTCNPASEPTSPLTSLSFTHNRKPES